MIGSPEARSLLAQHPAIDLHADTLLWARMVGYDLAVRHRPPLPAAAYLGHVDVPRLIDGGIGAQFFGLVSFPSAKAGPGRGVDRQIDLLDGQAAREDGKLRKVVSADQIEDLRGTGRVGALLGVEGAHALGGDLGRVDALAQRGVRYLGLVHLSANLAGRPARGWGRRDSEGLTPWGRELVARCDAARVAVDLAHINRRGFFDACAVAQRPVIVSHTGVSGVAAHPRNIDDQQLRAVAETGGVVGIMFAARYLGGRDLGAVARHLLHVVDVAGDDTPALGSDWDGMIVPVRGLSDVAHLPLLVDELLARKMPEAAIAKILRGNVQRVLRAVAS
jgi:membrane dipeptidase